MARIRSLKPEFWDDRKLAKATSRDARMLYMGLWNQADEFGRLNGDPLWLKGRVFPYDDDITVAEVEFLLAQLVAAGRVRQYEVEGDPYLYLPKLEKHQRLEPTKVASKIPAPPDPCESASSPQPRATSSEPRADKSAPDAESSVLLYGTGSMGHVAGSMGHVGGAATDADATKKRGSRLPDDWQPTVEDVAWSRGKGIPDQQARDETEKFGNHWRAKTGRDATKLDWSATWRNWLMNAIERNGIRGGPVGGAGATKAQGWFALVQPNIDQASIEGRTA